MRITLVIFSFLICQSAYSQKPAQWARLGDESMTEGDYLGAAIYYRNALELESGNAKMQYKYAEASRLHNDYETAEEYYRRIYEKEYGKFYPEGIFWLATMQKNLGYFDEARRNFKIASTKFGLSREMKAKAKNEIKACEWAANAVEVDSVEIKNNYKSVNTVHGELGLTYLNQNEIVIGSLRGKLNKEGELKSGDYFANLYHSKFINGNWSKTKLLDSTLNIPGVHTANPFFDVSTNELYFSRCNDSLNCKILISKYEDGVFSEPLELKNEVNLPGSSSTQPFIFYKENEKWLLFSSNRSGGAGGYDLYTAKWSGDRFRSVINLGKKINSRENEVTPSYNPENQTLYFSSTWHKGFGALDIFSSKGIPGKLFSKPENMLLPINSSYNDLYFISRNDTNGYFASNRPDAIVSKWGTCCNDFFSYRLKTDKSESPELDTLPVITKLEDLAIYLPITLYFHNDEPNPRTTDTLTYLNYLSTYREYKQLVPQYVSKYSSGLDVEEKTLAETAMENFFVSEVDDGVTDLDFMTKLLYRELEKGREIVLGIKGYASPLANSDYNLNLTLRRISSLINYFNNYENGKFKPFIDRSDANGGELSFKKIPFGEVKSAESVSDNLQDLQNSVYSISAALERRIEILEITSGVSEKAIEEEEKIDYEYEEYTLESAKKGSKIKKTISFTNDENFFMLIEHVETSCGCTLVNFTREKILPGEKGAIDVTIDTSELKRGKNQKTVTVMLNEGKIIKDFFFYFDLE